MILSFNENNVDKYQNLVYNILYKKGGKKKMGINCNSVIVGVKDMVSKAGVPMRQIYCTSEEKQPGLIGSSAFMVWAFKDSELFSFPSDRLLGVECLTCQIRGEYAIAYVDADL